MRQQIALGEAFQKRNYEFWGEVARGECNDLTQMLFVACVGMQTLVVNGPAQIVESSRVELPQHFDFPRRKGFGIDGFDISVGEQSEQREAFGCPNCFAK